MRVTGTLKGSVVKAANETVVLNVDQDCINRGKIGSVDRCPIALAIRRRFPAANKIWVTYTDIVFFAAGHCYYMPMPEHMLDFVDTFDAAPATVVPVRFRTTFKICST